MDEIEQAFRQGYLDEMEKIAVGSSSNPQANKTLGTAALLAKGVKPEDRTANAVSLANKIKTRDTVKKAPSTTTIMAKLKNTKE